ncbi:MAG: prephenate dehydrogenase/arogenate dehydrogenase family protein [Thermoleophilaceae bacterium]
MRIALLGVGLIGGSIGLAARERLDGEVEVAGFDLSGEVLATARERGAIDSEAASVEEALDGAEACFVCTPVGALGDLIAAALDAAAGDCVVSDVGSTKRDLARSITDERFIGGHPVAGAETSGVAHARADLFEEAAWYLTPGERASGVLYERLHRMTAAFGARPAAIDAEVHDRLLAAVSHLPHVVANVLVSQAGRMASEENEPLPRVGPSFRDATRVAGANSDIWTDIYMANGEAIAAEIDAAVERLAEVAKALRGADADAVRAWNDEARDQRLRLAEAELAAGDLHELRVSVPNRPGIVAQVALALGRASLNIEDLALAPAPDMRSGSITIWIAGDDAAARAVELIDGLGYPVAEA